MADGLPSRRPQKAVYVSWCPKDAIDGMSQLDIYEELAYRRIIDFIYTTGDTLEDNDRKLGIMTKLGTARWRKVKDALVNKYGKLQVVDGRITNVRCQEELIRVAERISQKIRAGKASAEARANVGENSRDLDLNSLKQNKTAPTDVGPNVGANVGTNQEPSKKEDVVVARVREERGFVPEPIAPPPKLPSVSDWKPKSGGMTERDRRVAAISQSLTDAIEAAYGHEHLRSCPPTSEKNLIPRYLDLAAEFKISEDTAAEILREYFFTQCAKRREEGKSVPGSIALFERSIADQFQQFATARDRPLVTGKQANGYSGTRRQYSNGSDAPTVNTVDQPWQRVQKRLMSAGYMAAARELSAAAAQGSTVANQLAAELEGRHLPKKHPVTRAA